MGSYVGDDQVRVSSTARWQLTLGRATRLNSSVLAPSGGGRPHRPPSTPTPTHPTHGLWKVPGLRKPRTQLGPPVSLSSTAPTRRGPRSAVSAAPWLRFALPTAGSGAGAGTAPAPRRRDSPGAALRRPRTALSSWDRYLLLS